MGMDKFLLKVDERTTFLEYLINQYTEFGCETIVAVFNAQGVKIVNETFPEMGKRITIVCNSNPEWGRFCSLKQGLKEIHQNQNVFIQNIDNPFVNLAILYKLVDEIKCFDFSYPTFNGKGGHPVLISSTVKSAILQESSNDLNLKLFLKKFNEQVCPVDDERVLLNINTPDDYKKIAHKLKQ